MQASPGYFEGLLHQQNNFKPAETSAEEIHRDNERYFIEGSSSSMEGPFKYLSADRVAIIHEEIDERL